MRVLVAPDKFKGTLTAVQAAEAVAKGWRRSEPDADIDLAPMADGGEGTLDTLVQAMGGRRERRRVTGPLGDPVDADFGLIDRPEGVLGIVEMARASGLSLIPERRRDPKRTTTRGTGELILAAAEAGATTLLVCLGGSGTNDGGAGMAQAVGIRLLDDWGAELPPGGAALPRLARIDATGADPAVRSSRITGATDVDNPLTGPMGASAVYGPQKGATPEDVAMLDRALGHLASVIHRDLGIDVRSTPGAGAAGGLGAGLVAFLGAHLRPGVDVVIEAVHLAERMTRADVAVTGEGRFDEQSLHGKVPAGVLRLAQEHRVPAVVVCGEAETTVEGVPVKSLAERFGPEAAMDRAGPLLADLAAEVAAEWPGREG
ncbi:MAG TPA: glycerate kinase [Actinomycetota bacterium]|nr:glycerate kinase [Actinomycetota bacterium]